MILAFFLGVMTDLAKKVVIFIIIPDESWFHYANIFASYTGYFAQLALILNLRIWTSYLIKTKFMANSIRSEENMGCLIQQLERKIKTLNFITYVIIAFQAITGIILNICSKF